MLAKQFKHILPLKWKRSLIRGMEHGQEKPFSKLYLNIRIFEYSFSTNCWLENLLFACSFNSFYFKTNVCLACSDQISSKMWREKNVCQIFTNFVQFCILRNLVSSLCRFSFSALCKNLFWKPLFYQQFHCNRYLCCAIELDSVFNLFLVLFVLIVRRLQVTTHE